MDKRKYKLVIGNGANDLNTEVNKLLNEGWELYGYTFSGNHYYLYQAVTFTPREEAPPNT